MDTALKYSVQLLDSVEQLSGAFQLRYKTYKVAYPNSITYSTYEFETDIYDPRSIHIGLFAASNTGKTMVGYSRLIIPPAFEKRFANLCFKNHPMYFKHYKSKNKMEKLH